MTDEDETLVIVIDTSPDSGGPEPPAQYGGIPEDAKITVTVDPILAEAIREHIDPSAHDLLHTFSSSGVKVMSARAAADIVVGLHRSQQFQTVVLGGRALAATDTVIRLIANALWTQVYDDEYKRLAVRTVESANGADSLLRHMWFYMLTAEEVIPYRKGLELFSEDEDLFVPEEWEAES